MEVDKKCRKILIEIRALLFKKLKLRSEFIEELFIISDLKLQLPILIGS